ncbi:MAG: type II toxin-antitoxin system MqsA family antitoxin [Acidimicrobiales bacterium]
MKCILCRSGHTQPGTEDKALTFKGTTLVIQGVPAEVCDTCGERYFDAKVVRQLVVPARDAALAGVIVDVRRYPIAA